MSPFSFVPSVLAAAPVLAAITLVGCVRHYGGPVTTEMRHASGTSSLPSAATFSQIDLRGPIDVFVREGAETSISVTGDPSTQAHVQTRVEGDTLVVDLDEDDSYHCFGICIDRGDPNARVTIALPALRSATLEGSGDLTVEASGRHPEVDLDIRGSGDVRYRGDADFVRCILEGSGDVTLRGTGRRLEARVHGSGDVHARDFPVEGGVYEIQGSGNIATVVHGGEMSVQIEGSGDLMYGGEARITSLDVSGSGSVRQLGHASEEE